MIGPQRYWSARFPRSRRMSPFALLQALQCLSSWRSGSSSYRPYRTQGPSTLQSIKDFIVHLSCTLSSSHVSDRLPCETACLRTSLLFHIEYIDVEINNFSLSYCRLDRMLTLDSNHSQTARRWLPRNNTGFSDDGMDDGRMDIGWVARRRASDLKGSIKG
ncbi:uncharacterized protein MYCFIDRAFT_203185 [Pseudocercospora fijiensis CIRAD86]|uniref:Uncharacterized protein n=1 Tax=Pseudocercospora fijiensis (strain CIRAD86) TaxID=383855 RepID=M3AJW8_PSEFD|nr:uncharacterized protein MYCFIDRAFT_203185 [Pseudocercospora fijiensis CIRAD86]EME84866.1 hypothetical protein MYCFIDRAFT_203185 [Pseudocercospora fijiensis CIRAD86]